MKILVVGATGMLGAPVARRLLADGHTVNVLARDPEQAQQQLGEGFTYYQGDVLRPETLRPALEASEGVHINLRSETGFDYEHSAERLGTENIARLAAKIGLKRLTTLTGAGDLDGHVHLPPMKIKVACEQALKGSGVPYTIFRATHFMESLSFFIRGNKAAVLGQQPHRYHYLAADDYAAMVSKAFSEDAAANQTFTVFGPEAFTMTEALAHYTRIVYPGVKVTKAPLWLLGAIGTLTGNQQLKTVHTLFRTFQQLPESGDPEPANQLLGRPTTTLDAWCQQQVLSGKK